MRSRRSFLALAILGAATLGPAVWAAGGFRAPTSSPASPIWSRDYAARLDGPLATAAGADGRLWTTWSYRGSGEFDLAVAVREIDGSWSPTIFLGRRDGIDQIDPAIALDDAGTVYVTYATRSPQRIWLSMLSVDAAGWSEPALVSTENGAAPALRMVRDRVVVAYRTARGIRIVDVPAFVAPPRPDGIQDGPDGVDPLGNGERSDLDGDGGDSDDSDPPPSDDETDPPN